MENNLLRGLFGISSPRLEEQRVAPQPIARTENIYYKIPSGMIEKLRRGTFGSWVHMYPIWEKLAIQQKVKNF